MCYCTPGVRAIQCNKCGPYMNEKIETLRARVKELEAHQGALLEGYADARATMFSISTNTELRQQLATMTLERDEAIGTSAENAIKYVKVRDQLAACEKERDGAADKALYYAAKYNDIVQAITDPENQPSQYGTVRMEQLAACEKERDAWRQDYIDNSGIEELQAENARLREALWGQLNDCINPEERKLMATKALAGESK